MKSKFTLRFLLASISGFCVALGMQSLLADTSPFMWLATGFALCASIGGPIGYVVRGRGGIAEGIVIAVIVGVLYGLIATPSVQMSG